MVTTGSGETSSGCAASFFKRVPRLRGRFSPSLRSRCFSPCSVPVLNPTGDPLQHESIVFRMYVRDLASNNHLFVPCQSFSPFFSTASPSSRALLPTDSCLTSLASDIGPLRRLPYFVPLTGRRLPLLARKPRGAFVHSLFCSVTAPKNPLSR